MKNLNSIIITLLISYLVIACNSTKIAKINDEASAPDLCNQVKQLVSQHKNGFEQLKGNLQATKFMDVWQAKYQLVGNNCQIWRWSDGKQAYMCSLTVPNKAAAKMRVEKAIGFTKECLGSVWDSEKIVRNKAGAFRHVFSNQASSTVASVHGVKTEGLFKSEWTVYYFIGDPDRSL